MAQQALIATSTSPAAPWKALLQKSLAQNASLATSKYLQLATVRQDGRPANRTVVFRGFLGDTDHLTFVTDRRSRKVSELAADPRVELCWYFPTSREQYRLSGVVAVVAEGEADPELLRARQEAWARMSDAGRSQFMWPHPGQPRMPMDEALFLEPAPESAGEAVASFCLGVVQVHEVDHVDLYTNKRSVYSSQPAAAGEGAAHNLGAAEAAAAGATAQRPLPAGGRAWACSQVNP